MKMIMEKQMECRLAGETEVLLGGNLPQRHFCPSQNPTRPDPALNPGRRAGKPASNRLSYGAANRILDLRTADRFSMKSGFAGSWPSIQNFNWNYINSCTAIFMFSETTHRTKINKKQENKQHISHIWNISDVHGRYNGSTALPFHCGTLLEGPRGLIWRVTPTSDVWEDRDH
jgi:hypothetical protein